MTVYELAINMKNGEYGKTVAEKKAALAELGYVYDEVKSMLTSINKGEDVDTSLEATYTLESTDTLTTEEVVEETSVEEPEVEIAVAKETTDSEVEQPSFTYYTVKPYDTIQSVSFKFAVNSFAVADANGMSVYDRLSVGQILKIPN